MQKLDYHGLLEDWKTDLICSRARRFGIPSQDWPDIQQEVILDILAFTYDPNNAGNATERTALTAIIDRKIISLLRRQSHQDRTFDGYLEDRGLTIPDESLFGFTENQSLHLDLVRAIGRLPDRHKLVCIGILEGYSIHRIARKLACHPKTVKGMIAHIHEVFKKMGVDQWLR
ncbi:MAG: sigma-70 family RNA polymerase sigma factor [Anaerohalosphaeraceae bacterium]|jgi:RNA polymerase sigma factor (sigma-70 family)